MFKKELIIVFCLQITLGLFHLKSAVAQDSSETANSSEEYVPRPKPIRKESLADESTTKAPSTARRLTSSEITALQKKPCPSAEFCPGLNYDSLEEPNFAPECSRFIDNKGDFGDLGREMLDALKEVELSILDASKTSPISMQSPNQNSECSFINSEYLIQGCPNFQNLSVKQRDHVWVWFWASVAQARSKCKSENPLQARSNTKLGRRVFSNGIFNLEYTANERSINGSDPSFCPHTPVETSNLFYQSRCATSIVLKSAKCRGRGRNQNFGEQLISNQPIINQLLKGHPLCKI